MAYFDAIVIGGGVLGCFAARNLRRWNISTLLLEAGEDVCTGITRANSAIVYAGYDNKPGSLKAELTVRSNANMESLCAELEVPFSRCGSLLVTYEADTLPRLEKKCRQGRINGVPGLQLLTGEQARELEPMLRHGVMGALYAPTTGTVNPWHLGIAAWENALQNGAESRLNAPVRKIEQAENGYRVFTQNEEFCCKMIFNCAGAAAARVQALIYPPRVRLHLDGAEYLVLDPLAQKPERVIFLQSSACGKGITAIPCVEGNLLLSGVRKPLDIPYATTPAGLRELHADAQNLLPELDLTQVIRSFGAVRPNPVLESGESVHDFCIENPGPGFYSLIGVKTPGLTCANELGLLLAKLGAVYLNAEENPQFDPHRRAIPKTPGRIVCQCGGVTESEIREAIRRGAKSVDAVKRRVGTGMGRCQGSRCAWVIERMLEEANGTL